MTEANDKIKNQAILIKNLEEAIKGMQQNIKKYFEENKIIGGNFNGV